MIYSVVGHYSLILGLGIGLILIFFSIRNFKNSNLIQYYALESMQSISPQRFLDFQEPTLIVNQDN